MTLMEKAERIRIYIGEDDKYNKRPLADLIVEEAKKAGLAGATMFRGMSGFGANSLIHTTKILRLSEDLPVIVEIIDHPDAIDPFLKKLDSMLSGGMITREPVTVTHYRHHDKK